MNKLKNFVMKVMRGRYGVDILSRDMSWFATAAIIIGLLLRNTIFSTIGIALVLISYARMFSKRIAKRYNENRSYLNMKGRIKRNTKNFFQRIKDFPKYKYFRCPNCNKQLRVPRGKKEVTVKCPQCQTKFDART